MSPRLLLGVGLALIHSNALAQAHYRLLEPSKPESRLYAVHPAEVDPATWDRPAAGSWKKPLGITVIVLGSVVGGLFALYSLERAPGSCEENYDEGSPDRKDCENRAEQATLGFLGGLAMAGASIAGGVILIKMAPSRKPAGSGMSPPQSRHDLAFQWTYAF